MNERSKISWTIIKEFEENGILVEISESSAYRPQYNVRVGRRGERGTIPFLQLRVEGQGKVRVVDVSETVAKLLSEAQKFVEDRAQDREDKFIAERIERESKQVEREGKKRRPSGYRHHGSRQKNAH